MNKKAAILTFILCNLPSSSLGNFDAKIFFYQPYEIIKTQLGLGSHNRISFENMKVKKIVGDEKEYQLLHDHNGSHLFLLPKISKGKKLHIAIITVNNLVQEFDFEILENLKRPIIVRFNKKYFDK